MFPFFSSKDKNTTMEDISSSGIARAKLWSEITRQWHWKIDIIMANEKANARDMNIGFLNFDIKSNIYELI